jgi:hypothetical protein
MKEQVIKNIIEKLRVKSNDKGRMPSIKSIHELLSHFGIEHEYRESMNTVESRTSGCNYANSRHDGKTGNKIVLRNPYLELDTSCSYYSYNTYSYASKILKLIEDKK